MRFEDALNIAGLLPREIVADGRWRRCATKDKPNRRNGAYRLDLDGLRGWFRNWALDDGLQSWSAMRGSAARVVDEEKLAKQRERQRAERMRAIGRAREFWHRARPTSLMHPYLADKGLSALGTAGLRVAEGLLVIPVMWKGHVISVQTIHPNGQKRFWPGAPVKGGSFVIERERPAVTVFVEGLATGLAVFQCVRVARVVVCFDAGNLFPVIDGMRPTGSVIVAADNDHGTLAKRGFNPGIDKATNAAELIGAGVAWPQGIEGTDFADMLKELGEGSNRRIERLILGKAKYVAKAAA